MKILFSEKIIIDYFSNIGLHLGSALGLHLL